LLSTLPPPAALAHVPGDGAHPTGGQLLVAPAPAEFSSERGAGGPYPFTCVPTIEGVLMAWIKPESIVLADSPEPEAVRRAGVEVAHDGLEVQL
jgi:hypothetical protein